MKLMISLAILFILSTNGEFVSKDPRSFGTRLKQARRILSEVPLVDGHNDLAMCLHDHLDNQLDYFDFHNLIDIEPWNQDQYSQTDLPRLKKGMVGAEFWSAWVPCKASKVDALVSGLEQIDVIKRLIKKYSQEMQFADSTEGIINAFERRKIASLIGVEGGHMIENSLAVLRLLYDNGVRYLTLTHACDTMWAESYSDFNGTGKVKGLTDFGKIVVGEMNRLGMMVDLSHSSVQTMDDALSMSAAPVIFSHSAARALCDTPPNIPDHVLLKLRRNGGIVMVNFFPPYISCSNKASIHDVINHINYIRDFIGVDHVGIGSDFNGMKIVPDGLNDVSTFPYLFAELMLDPKWTDMDLRKLAGLNFLRVFELVESVKEILLDEQPIDMKM